MAYALQSMLRIREMREDRSSKELVAARHQRDVAVEQVSKREVELSRYRETREERRDEVFAAVMGRPVSLDELAQARAAVSRIDEEGTLLNDGVVRAKAELQKREDEAETARGNYVLATRNHQKVLMHKQVWQEEERRAEERAADAEMEEFTGRRMTDDESDDFD